MNPNIVSAKSDSYTPTKNSATRVKIVSNVKKITKGFSRGSRTALNPGTLWQTLSWLSKCIRMRHLHHCKTKNLPSTQSGQHFLDKIGR